MFVVGGSADVGNQGLSPYTGSEQKTAFLLFHGITKEQSASNPSRTKPATARTEA